MIFYRAIFYKILELSFDALFDSIGKNFNIKTNCIRLIDAKVGDKFRKIVNDHFEDELHDVIVNYISEKYIDVSLKYNLYRENDGTVFITAPKCENIPDDIMAVVRKRTIDLYSEDHFDETLFTDYSRIQLPKAIFDEFDLYKYIYYSESRFSIEGARDTVCYF